MEGDEGMYTCNVMILETNASNVTDVSSLTGIYAQHNQYTPITILPHLFAIQS